MHFKSVEGCLRSVSALQDTQMSYVSICCVIRSLLKLRRELLQTVPLVYGTQPLQLLQTYSAKTKEVFSVGSIAERCAVGKLNPSYDDIATRWSRIVSL